MFNVVKKILDDRRLKMNLLKFLAEMEKNLEAYYVMDQRQFIIHGFQTEFLALVKEENILKKHESIQVYVRSIEEFNALHTEHKAFEQWYASDMANKTPENAKKLHALKHQLDSKLKGLEAVIILGGQDLEREMLRLGLLKA